MYRDNFEQDDEIRKEYENSLSHDCANDRENCDTLHPNAQRVVMVEPPIVRSQQLLSPNWRNWMLKPKVVLGYYNPITLRSEAFNLSEVFAQMSSNAKLNVVHTIIANCLDDNERSLLFADLKQ